MTDVELLRRIVELFNHIELTEEERDEVLRENGYDPDELGKKFAEFARDATARAYPENTPSDEP